MSACSFLTDASCDSPQKRPTKRARHGPSQVRRPRQGRSGGRLRPSPGCRNQGRRRALASPEKRLVLALDRFDWPAAMAVAPGLRRCRAALRFERVLACKCKNVDPAGKDQVLNLLAVEFAEASPPGGAVTLTFSGGATLRLEVECLEVEL